MGAIISKCGQYRYMLKRVWGKGPMLPFCMLNPSTADHLKLDPTLTRCAVRAAAGLSNYRWHDHRHTFASWARMAGVDIADIADALFHSGIQMTTRYAHITPEHASTAWSRVATNSPLAAGQGKEEE